MIRFVESSLEGFNAFVGERGVRLSGGQRQRIGIARALYRQASILILVEATSASDNKTEQFVMLAIEALDCEITILIITHRLTTIRNCDQVVQLKQGKITAVGIYEDLLEYNGQFLCMANAVSLN